MKRLSKYLQVVVNTIAESSEFRFNHLLSFLVIALPLVFTMLLWRKVLGEGGQIGVFDLQRIITYYFLVVLFQDITYPGPFWEIIDHIRDKLGINIPYLFLSFLTLFLLGIFAGFNKYLVFPLNIFYFVLFLVSFFLAVVLGFTLSFIFSALTFWLEEGRGIEVFLEFLISLTSGVILPVSLYPRFLKTLCNLLPFRYILNFSVEVYLGIARGRALYLGFLAQASWALIVLLLLKFIWNEGLKRYEAVGA
jgi:ABC-2 type transport system permease protein